VRSFISSLFLHDLHIFALDYCEMRQRFLGFPLSALGTVILSILALSGGILFLTTVPAAANAKPAAVHSVRQKQSLRGLVDMGVQAPYALDTPFPTVDTSAITPYAGAFGGIVINEGWAQLEPSAGHERWQDLDTSLSAVKAWNIAHPTAQVGVKFRIFGGNTAPDWAKSLGGSPITVVTKGISHTYGRWWTNPYAKAWSSFQHALAARYDDNPLVRAVSVSSCATLTGEPFVMNMTRQAIQVMQAAGWTPQAQQRCLNGALADYSGWVHTPVTFAFNPYRTVTNGIATADPSLTIQIMRACAQSRTHDGPECVLGNNALSDTAVTGRSGAIYSEIDALWRDMPGHVGVYFQTVGAGVDCASVALGITHHATSVEVWPPHLHYDGFAAVPRSTLRQWNEDLGRDSALSCAA
jgi:hypothetical protein